MARHSVDHEKDYFEARAEVLEEEQRLRYLKNPPKDDDLLRHLDELRSTELINNFRITSETYNK